MSKGQRSAARQTMAPEEAVAALDAAAVKSAVAPQGTAALADAMWEAVVRRDGACDGRFVYAVRTTGVFCRPSCPARRPQRANVTFHPTPDDALAHGYRACRRCNPMGISPRAAMDALIVCACRTIESAAEPPALRDLAAAAGMSQFHFHRAFRARVGVTPKAYATALRQARVREALGRGAGVTEAFHEAGYGSSGRFYAATRDVLGMTPGSYRAGGASEEIRVAVGRCSLGHVLVAESAIGICAILLGDDPDALAREIRTRFPKATLCDGEPAFARVVAAVADLVDDPGGTLGLPLDIRGTAFQHQVWEALRRIPPGTTLTYAGLARAIGKPRAIRAAARACAQNTLAVAIPCHRVVASDGSLAGYRWGLTRKEALLATERRRQDQPSRKKPTKA